MLRRTSDFGALLQAIQYQLQHMIVNCFFFSKSLVISDIKANNNCQKKLEVFYIKNQSFDQPLIFSIRASQAFDYLKDSCQIVLLKKDHSRSFSV